MQKFTSCRPFGVEIELNAFDGASASDTSPEGIAYIADLVVKTVEEYVEVRGCGHTHWYKTHGYWVLKPDHSCGIEVCSPIMQGWQGLKKVCRVIEVFGNNTLIRADSRCSLHVHIDVSDLTRNEIDNILKWWIKCEPVFFDSVPGIRKDNRFCQFIGLWDWAQEDIQDLVKILGENKYYSVNSFHLHAGDRNTLEFRIGENKLCRNAYFAKNWIRLLIHFLEIAKQTTPKSLVWLDIKEVIEFLGFSSELSPGMIQIKNWFLARLSNNICDGSFGFVKLGRTISIKQIKELLNFDVQKALFPSDYRDDLYNKIYST
jgi:Putative amidoligase enzyme